MAFQETAVFKKFEETVQPKMEAHFRTRDKEGGGEYKTDTEAFNEVRENLAPICFAVYAARHGYLKDEEGEKIPARYISFDEALETMLGIKSERFSDGRLDPQNTATKKFIRGLGVYTSEPLSRAASRPLFANNAFSLTSLFDALKKRDNLSFDSLTTSAFPDAWRFIFPEIIMSAMRVSYLHTAQHANWISGTQAIAQPKITMPQILEGTAFPRIIREGGTIPMGTVRYNQKSVKTFKVGLGIEMTDELINDSSIDHLGVYLEELGSKIAIGEDNVAKETLYNGDQDDLSEASPVIGVESTVEGIRQKDLVRLRMRMKRLGLEPTRLISNEMAAIQDLEKANTSPRYVTPSQFVNLPEDVFSVPEGQIGMLNSLRALMKLEYMGFRVEEDRSAETQTNRHFITKHIGFAKIKKDAFTILDPSLSFAEAGFPEYMDVDKVLSDTFME